MRSQRPLLTLLFVSYSQRCKPDDGLRVGRNMLFHLHPSCVIYTLGVFDLHYP